MIYLDSEHFKTIQIALANFIEEYSANYEAIMAGTVISITPVVAVYAIVQKYIIQGIAYAEIKG